MSWLPAALIGLISGTLAAMGLGGGFVLIAALALLSDLSQRAAQGVNLFFFLPVTLFALIMHLKNRLIDGKAALIFSLFGLPFAVGGAFLSAALPGALLRKGFALFVIGVGVKELLKKK